MERLKKLLLVFVLGAFFAGISIPTVSALGILPSGQTAEYRSCQEIKDQPVFKQALSDEKSFKDFVKGGETLDISKRDVLEFLLGCAVKFGRVRLFMIPYFITYIIQFLLGIAGLVAVLFVVIGGYHYVVGGLIEEKEKGKTTIRNALMGLIVALSAWMVVNFIQVALTS